ncbi:MAG TPA: hypothetical protein DDY98_01565 [Ruminococcaceae bacterium]|nr:hypothetical protein [Oscillospiraceae bacterium]
MKNRKSIFAVLLLAGLLLTTGCGKKSETLYVPNTGTQVQTQAPETHERTDTEMKASIDSLSDGSSILESYRSNEIAFSNEAKLYGMDSETAAQVTFKEGSFRCYVLNIKVKNTKRYDLTVQAVHSPNNGKDGVWVCGVSQYGLFDVTANRTADMPVTVLVDNNITKQDAVEQVLKSMNLSLEYTDLTDTSPGPGEAGTVEVV